MRIKLQLGANFIMRVLALLHSVRGRELHSWTPRVEGF